MGRHKNTPTNKLTDAQLIRECRPKVRYYLGTEGKRWPRPCLVCGEQITGTLGDLEQHQSLHVDTQYDYDNQAWVINGLYSDCAHPVDHGCQCYGRLHQGEKAPSIH
jgi:hypothetical protein